MSRGRRYLLGVPFCMFILALASAQQSAVEFSDMEAWPHRIGQVAFIHTDQFDNRSIFLHDSITLSVIVAADGRVESAHAFDGPREFYAEAETLEREQRFKPFEQNGVPVRAAIKDYVRLAPPEQWSAQPVPFPEIKDSNSLRMTLARTACYGTCPAYSIEVRGDGTVIYIGKMFVLITGEHHSRISKERVQELFAKFRSANYFSLNDEYRAGITDNPTETTSIEFNGRKKQVIDYVGSYVGMPDVVGDLEQSFDQLAGSDKWIKETSETWPSLVAEHWNFKAKTAENAELFSSVVSRGSAKLIDDFVAAGAPAVTTSKSPQGQPSALASAAAKGNLELVRRMLDANANVPPPLMFDTLRAAAGSGNLELVHLLIERGAEVNGSPSDPRDEQTVLMAAVHSGKADVVKEILLHRPDVNATAYGGQTALTMALGIGRDSAVPIIASLLAYGANLSQTDEQGRTPLFAACYTPSAVRLLVAAGADVNARDRGGQTPLMNCSYKNDFVAAMLEAGADPTLRDSRGATALDRARQMSAKDAAELIEAALKRK
jgi:ankyrin repeat protein